jgi:hypothetical protein
MADLPPVLFIPGFKGSFLKDSAGGRTAFITLAQLLNLSTPEITLPKTWSDTDGKGKRQGTDGIVPTGVLKDVFGSLSGAAGAKVYGNVLGILRETYGKEITTFGSLDPDYTSEYSPDTRLYAFAYDWRRSNNENVVRLTAVLRSFPVAPQIVAHSNGGLLAYATLNGAPNLAHSVCYCAAPFNANSSFMADLCFGKSTGLFNKKHLSASVVSSFPTLYTLLPLLPSENASQYIKAAAGSELPGNLDFTKAETFSMLRLGPSDLDPAFLQNCLDDAVAFKNLLLAQPAGQHPVTHAIAGTGTETFEGFVWSSGAPIDVAAFGSTTDGDGRFSQAVVQPPAACNCTKTWVASAKHEKVMDDGGMLGAVLKAMREEVRERAGGSASVEDVAVSLQ